MVDKLNKCFICVNLLHLCYPRSIIFMERLNDLSAIHTFFRRKFGKTAKKPNNILFLFLIASICSVWYYIDRTEYLVRFDTGTGKRRQLPDRL